ncbi:early nodulin-11-like [Neltuma alba]|uniref:early nodulin-11-like n=1 Tax=Neltuma alba TaxID=207710 RepID=UPI0010A2EB98|nr:early nodulin-11-like [Prosopis alba]
MSSKHFLVFVLGVVFLITSSFADYHKPLVEKSLPENIPYFRASSTGKPLIINDHINVKRPLVYQPLAWTPIPRPLPDTNPPKPKPPIHIPPDQKPPFPRPPRPSALKLFAPFEASPTGRTLINDRLNAKKPLVFQPSAKSPMPRPKPPKPINIPPHQRPPYPRPSKPSPLKP